MTDRHANQYPARASGCLATIALTIPVVMRANHDRPVLRAAGGAPSIRRLFHQYAGSARLAATVSAVTAAAASPGNDGRAPA